jgi:hypothetical protein
MAARKARWAQPACDPDLPEGLRRLVTEPLAGREPRRERRRLWRGGGQRELARLDHQIVYPHDLHEDDRIVLARVQLAIDTILTSEVLAEGLVAAEEPVLRRHEWDVAVALREITELRRLHAVQDPAGQLTVAVLAAQQRAISLAADATGARVAALERFAGQVAAADAARRDWREALELSGLNDRYLDLVARTAADQLAVSELNDLTEQAALAARALQDSLRAAVETAEMLALP